MANDITQITINAKRMKVRLVCKHDTEANWIRAINFKPEKGELIIYDIDNNHSYERMKIGDGKTLVSNLPFVLDNVVINTSNLAKLNGSNTFTGSNKFTQEQTFNLGIHLGLTAAETPEVNDLWGIDKEGFKAAGKTILTQTIKFPDFSTFETTTHTIPLNDTNNTFTGNNTFNNGGFKVNSSYGIEALSIDPLNSNGTGHTGMTTLTSAIDKYCSIQLGAGILSISSKGVNANTGHITINTGTSGVNFNIGNNTDAIKILTDGLNVNSKTKYCGGKIENIVSGTTHSLTLPQKTGTFALTNDINVTADGDNLFTGTNTFKGGINTASINVGEMKSDGETISDTVILSTRQDFSTTGYPTSKVQFKSASEAEYNGKCQFTFLSTGGMESGANLNLINWDDVRTIFAGAQLRVKSNGNVSLNKLKYDKDTGDYNILASLTLPEKIGTIAITNDIPIKTATLDGTTLSITLS